MRIPIDYHMHSSYSCDSEAPMADMCRAAVSAGIDEIGFSEHFDSHPNNDCTDDFNVTAWWKEFETCKAEFREVLSLRAGLEISEPHLYIDEVDELLDSHPWDYAIGALHWIGDDIIFKAPYFQRTMKEAYNDYFIELQRMVEIGRFDILAHLDIVKRYGFDHYGEFHVAELEDIIRPTLNTLVSRGLALEVNTVTLRRSIQETTPGIQILEWFKEEGGRWISLGSDAHSVEDVGANLEDAIGVVLVAGFEEVAAFQAGRPTGVSISES